MRQDGISSDSGADKVEMDDLGNDWNDIDRKEVYIFFLHPFLRFLFLFSSCCLSFFPFFSFLVFLIDPLLLPCSDCSDNPVSLISFSLLPLLVQLSSLAPPVVGFFFLACLSICLFILLMPTHHQSSTIHYQRSAKHPITIILHWTSCYTPMCPSLQ
ncbi:hypothetical protein VTN02DRAFT_4282 [Thermoascus thermophilus]